jgi:hypothetical protein
MMKAAVAADAEPPFEPLLDRETEHLDFVPGKCPKVILPHDRTENV